MPSILCVCACVAIFPSYMDPCPEVLLLLLLFVGSSCTLCCVPFVYGAEQLMSNETVILFGAKVVIWRDDDAKAVEAGRSGNGRVTVHIQNRLGGGKNLSVHCKSKDDDLKQQTLVEGQELVWGFNPNVWGTTLFFCDLNPTLNFVFEAYDYKRDQVRCSSQCIWLVAAEGMYARDEAANLWTYMYPWSSS